MALNALRLRIRLRRALSMSSIFGRCKGTKPLSTTAAAAISGHSLSHPSASSRVASLSPCLQMSRRFHSTPLTLSASRSYEDDDKFDPDTILFEGCDYKHWLITLDFPKEPEPSAEEKVETYVQTLAKVVGSVEEAKKRMYACSTTTYNGFQAEIDEETAKKFEGMPGVVFVLPDSYIDPVNKEYGGDKYINGRIIPRPPPVQYGRTRRPNRNYDQRPRHQMSNQQVNPVYDQQGSMRGDGMGYTPQQNIPPPQNFQPHNNYGLLGQANNYAHGRDNEYPARARNAYQGDTGSYMPTNRGNFNQGSNYPQGQMADFSGYQGNNYPQGRTANFSEYQGNNHPQGQMGNFSGDQRSYAAPGHTGFLGDSRGYAPAPQLGGSYGQTGTGTYGQGGVGPYGPGASGNYDPGATSGYEPSYTARGENQRVGPQTPQQGSNMQREQRDYTPAGQTAMNQERN